MTAGPRECGDCIVCCVYPRIESEGLSKPPMHHCPHLTLPGLTRPDMAYYTGASCHNCNVYADRPQLCVDYKCAWLEGYGKEEDRPDRSFLLFDRSRSIRNALECKPLRDGEDSTESGLASIRRMSASHQTPVIVCSFYERRIVRIVGRAW